MGMSGASRHPPVLERTPLDKSIIYLVGVKSILFQPPEDELLYTPNMTNFENFVRVPNGNYTAILSHALVRVDDPS